MKTDVIIIGAGPGGYRAAEFAAKQGLSVVIVEQNHLGGTCLNEGCIPTKCLCRNAEVIDTMRDAQRFGINCDGFSFDFNRVQERKAEVVGQLRNGVEQLLSQPAITILRGHATLRDAHTVDVEGQTVEGQYIVIATGSRTKWLPIEGAKQQGVVDSTGLLSVSEVPRRLCIIGAGVIGMEFASCFSSFGSQVVVVEYLKEALPSLDSDVAKRLRQSMAKRGIEFYMQSAVERITPDLEVVFSQKGKELSVKADLVLMATGRTPNVENLGLETVGIKTTRAGIEVNERMQTNVPNIYAIGDVNGRCMLAHAATAQGLQAIAHIVAGQPPIGDLQTEPQQVPAAIFTHPEAASVGPSEQQLKEQGVDYVCRKGFFRANGKALAQGDTDGMVKLFASADDGRIIGCHLFGPHAADIAQEVSALMCKQATLEELATMIHIHPTLGEVLQEMAL